MIIHLRKIVGSKPPPTILRVLLGKGRLATSLVTHEKELNEWAFLPLDLDFEATEFYTLNSPEALGPNDEKCLSVTKTIDSTVATSSEFAYDPEHRRA